MLNKKELSETLGLSCVEKYFCAWLSKFTDITKLYGDSFIAIGQVFDDFALGATYQNYCYMPRLQDVAEDCEMVMHEYIPCSASDAVKLLESASSNALCLMRVNTSFFTDFKRSSWREDHYVCVDGDLKWINEYPLSEGVFTQERFAQVYDGALCVYKFCGEGETPPDCATQAIISQVLNSADVPRSLAAAESAVGILRITRKRLEKFYFAKESVRKVFNEENKLLDKIYFDICLRRLKEQRKQRIDTEQAYKEICEDISKILKFEKNIAEELKNER